MNRSNDPLEEKFRELEAQARRSSQSIPQLSEKLQPLYVKLRGWFQMLPNWGKGTVAVLGALLTWQLVKGFFELAIALTGVVFLFGIAFFAYKFFIAPDTPESRDR